MALTTSITTPNMQGAYPKGASAYSGPGQTDAVVPVATTSDLPNHNHSGSTITISGHTHTFGSVGDGLLTDFADTGITISSTDAGHTHSYSTSGLSVNSGGSHTHTGSTDDARGSHTHPRSTAPATDYDLGSDFTSHVHRISAIQSSTSGSGGGSHSHSLTGIDGSGLSGSADEVGGSGTGYSDGDEALFFLTGSKPRLAYPAAYLAIRMILTSLIPTAYSDLPSTQTVQTMWLYRLDHSMSP